MPSVSLTHNDSTVPAHTLAIGWHTHPYVRAWTACQAEIHRAVPRHTPPCVTRTAAAPLLLSQLPLLRFVVAELLLETEEENPKFIHSQAKILLLLLLPLLLVAAPPRGRPGNRARAGALQPRPAWAPEGPP